MSQNELIKAIAKNPTTWAAASLATYLPYWNEEIHQINLQQDSKGEIMWIALKPIILAALAGVTSIQIKHALQRSGKTKLPKKRDLNNIPRVEKNMLAYIKHLVNSTALHYLQRPDLVEKEIEKAIENNPYSVVPHLYQADVALKRFDTDSVFHSLRKSLRAFKRSEKRLGPLGAIAAAERSEPSPLKEDDPINYLSAALYSYFSRKEKQSLEYLERAIELSEHHPDYQIFAAELLEEMLDSEGSVSTQARAMRTIFWERAVKNIKREEMEPAGESRNKVYKLSEGSFAEEMFILKEGDAMSLRAEIETSEIMQDIVGQYRGYFVSRPVAVLDGGELCIIRREPGKNLYQIIKEQGDYDSLMPAIVDILAIIHAQFPRERAGQREDIRATLESKLEQTKTSNAIKALFRWNYEPIEKAFKDAEFVYNKDAHPENWRYGESGEIGILDCERTRLVPQTFDLVNLMDYMNYLIPEEKDRLLEKYAAMYEEHGNPINIKELRFQYHNARIHRALSLNAAMQDRRTRQHERRAILKSAEEAISRIKEEEREYFESHNGQYRDIEQGILGLMMQNED